MELFTKSIMTVVRHPPYSPGFSPYDCFVSCHFYAIEVIEAESQAVLNILTEHDFQDAFTNDRSAEGDYFEEDCGQ
jgi:hypothetical protein